MPVNTYHLRSSIKGKEPAAGNNAGQLPVGSIAINFNADEPFLTIQDSAGNVRRIAGVKIDTTAPTTPTAGEWWVDTSGATKIVKVFDGTSWVATGSPVVDATEIAKGIVELATAAETAAGTDNTRAVHPAGLKATLDAHLTPGTSTPPVTPATGATYINTATTPAVINVWNGTAWVPQAGTAVTGGTAPGTPAAGQVWVDTSGATAATKIWDGTKWVVMTVDTGTQAKLDAQVASVWSRAGTVVSPANAGDQVHTGTGKLTVGGTAAAPNLEIKADGGIVANTDGLVYDAATKRLALGTSSAQQKLHVSSADSSATYLRVDNTSGQAMFGVDASGNAYAGAETNDAFGLVTNGSYHMYITAGGNVGIGTTSVSQPFVLSNGGAAGLEMDPNSADSGPTIQGYNRNTSAFIPITMLGSHLAFRTGSSPSERARIDSSGRLLVGTSSQSGGSLLQVNDNRIRIATAKTPASATDTGVAGEICWDANYVYVCTATNTWKRTAISTW